MSLITPGDMDRIIAQRIRRHRHERGLSARRLTELAQQLGATQLSQHSLVNIERWNQASTTSGRRVHVGELVIFAAALEVPIAALAPFLVPCTACGGKPPEGFTCRACGTAA